MMHTFMQRWWGLIIFNPVAPILMGSWCRNARVKLMGDASGYRELEVNKGKVPCLPGKEEPLEHCRLCIHAREFRIGKTFVKSPSLAYCLRCRVTEEIDLKKVHAVRCADRRGEGFHNIAGIIS
jgi:hypothetical protein